MADSAVSRPQTKVLTIYKPPRLVAVQKTATAINEQMLFRDAAPRWLDSRRPFISERTARDYDYYIARLNDFFGCIALENISSEHIREYQQLRGAKCGVAVINHELGVVKQLLERVHLWGAIADDYQPLPLSEQSPGRCVESWEEERYFCVAAANPNWRVAYLAMMIMRRTGICPGELRQVRLKDVDMDHRGIRIVFGKNVHRERLVPLPDTCWDALQELVTRAEKLGSTDPDHFLLPYRVRTGRYDPRQPASENAWRTAHREICAAADIKMRIYDWRHTAATRLLENPKVSTETAIAILGHVSPRMVRKVYNHTRFQAMKEALQSLDRDPKTRRPTAGRQKRG